MYKDIWMAGFWHVKLNINRLLLCKQAVQPNQFDLKTCIDMIFFLSSHF